MTQESIFSKGLDRVLDEVSECVHWTFGDWPEGEGIGSSDVSCVVRDVYRAVGLDPDLSDDVEAGLIRNAVRNKMSEVLADR